MNAIHESRTVPVGRRLSDEEMMGLPACAGRNGIAVADNRETRAQGSLLKAIPSVFAVMIDLPVPAWAKGQGVPRRKGYLHVEASAGGQEPRRRAKERRIVTRVLQDVAEHDKIVALSPAADLLQRADGKLDAREGGVGLGDGGF